MSSAICRISCSIIVKSLSGRAVPGERMVSSNQPFPSCPIRSPHGAPGPPVVSVVVPVIISVVIAVSLLTSVFAPVFPLILSQVGSEAADYGSDRHVALASPLVAAKLSASKPTDQSAGDADTDTQRSGVEVFLDFATETGA